MNYKDFEQFISDTILARGKSYFDDGAVVDLSKEEGYWFADVHGSEIYEVEVKGIRSIKGWGCNCPYDKGPICKHVVAVLYAVQTENNKSKSKKSSKPKKQVDQIFKNANPDALLKFFKKNLRHHKDLKQKLISEFIHLLDAGDKDRYNKVVDNLIKNAEGRHGLVEYRESIRLANAFNKFLTQAEVAIDKKNFSDALDICAAVLLKTPNLLLHVDDSSGSIQNSWLYALSIIKSMVDSPLTPPIFQDQIFDFMLNAFQKDKMDFDFKDDLLVTLLENKLDDSKLKRIQKVVQETFNNLEGEYIEHSQQFYIRILIDIAQQIGNIEEPESLISQYLHLPEIRKIKLEKLLGKEDYQSAKILVADGIKLATEKGHPGTVNKWKNQFIKISRLEKDVEEERRLLREAFFKNLHSMEYLLQLKDTFEPKEWIEEREQIITQILGKDKILNYNNKSTLAQIYVNEKLWDKLLDLLHHDKTAFHFIRIFGKYLHKDYPTEMLALYKPMIIYEATHANTRSKYRQVARSLSDLLKIDGGRDVVITLLTKFRQEYIKRPAMIDELSNLI